MTIAKAIRGLLWLLSVALLLGGSRANAADQAITGKKLLLKTSAGEGKFIVISKDPSISIAGSAAQNATLFFRTTPGPGNSTTHALSDGYCGDNPRPCWSANPSETKFKYKDKYAYDGSFHPLSQGTVKVVKLKSGLLKAIGFYYPNAPTGPATVDVLLKLDGGANNYCMAFTGTGDGEKFLVKDAVAATCPQCGNNTREIAERCDGTDNADCPGACQSDCRCPCATDSALACVVYYQGNAACKSCCDAAGGACSTPCQTAEGLSCGSTPDNAACAAAINAAGCAAECCN